MLQTLTIFKNSLLMALQELRNNKVRTFLSLLGVTIGIFCVVSVFTLTKSLEINVRQEMSSLGENVIFIQRWPWGGAGGDWWKYVQRPHSDYNEFKQLKARIHQAGALAYVYDASNQVVEYGSSYMKGDTMLGMTEEFGDNQNRQIEEGRFLNNAETTDGNMELILEAKTWQGLLSTAE